MRERIQLALAAFGLALALAGCLGSESEGPAPEARIAAGSYEGDYSYVPNSSRQGFEGELILNPDGTYRSLWLQNSEAVYDEHGSWNQRGSALYMTHSMESWADYRVFNSSKPIDDDTCALAQLTDTSFIRNEWIPVVLRKRQWTRYRLRVYPKLADGSYTLTDGIDSIPHLFRITLAGDKYQYASGDTLDTYQSESRFYQLGSFLALDDSRERTRDSTGVAWADWSPLKGTVLLRLRSVSDTAFDLWNPGSLFLPAGWEHYVRNR